MPRSYIEHNAKMHLSFAPVICTGTKSQKILPILANLTFWYYLCSLISKQLILYNYGNSNFRV